MATRTTVALAVVAGVCAAGVGVGVAQAGGGEAGPVVTQTDPEYLTDAAGRADAVGTSSGDRRASAAIATSSIAGRVTGASGVAAPGYTVEAFTSDGNFINDASTGADGRYQLTSLQPGPYKVKVSPPTGVRRVWAAGWFGGGSLLSARVVALTGVPAKVDVVLPTAGGLSGQVRGLAGGGTVSACGASFLDCRSAVIGPSGGFDISGLPAGVAQIVVRPTSGEALVFPKLPPRPGVLVKAGKRVSILLDAVRQGPPTVTSTTAEPPVPGRDTTPPGVLRAWLVTAAKWRAVRVSAVDTGGSGVTRMQLRVGTRFWVPRGYTPRTVAVPRTGRVAVRVADGAGNWSGWSPIR